MKTEMETLPELALEAPLQLLDMESKFMLRAVCRGLCWQDYLNSWLLLLASGYANKAPCSDCLSCLLWLQLATCHLPLAHACGCHPLAFCALT
ncbi:hypothetical protein ACLKA6_008257 [Drosophila palustris]